MSSVVVERLNKGGEDDAIAVRYRSMLQIPLCSLLTLSLFLHT